MRAKFTCVARSASPDVLRRIGTARRVALTARAAARPIEPLDATGGVRRLRLRRVRAPRAGSVRDLRRRREGASCSRGAPRALRGHVGTSRAASSRSDEHPLAALRRESPRRNGARPSEPTRWLGAFMVRTATPWTSGRGAEPRLDDACHRRRGRRLAETWLELVVRGRRASRRSRRTSRSTSPSCRASTDAGRPERSEALRLAASPRACSSEPFGIAPTAAACGSPSLNRTIVGIDATP